MPLYTYGAAAWFWRGLISIGIVLAAGFLVAGLASWSPLLIVGAAALIVPALFFGTVLVVRANRLEDDRLEVHTLLFWRRRIARVRLGQPRVRILYRSEHGDFPAPRVWVPVKGGWPLYFDLLAQIPDRQAFLAAIKLPAAELRAAERSPEA